MEYKQMNRILAGLGFDYSVAELEVLYKQEKSKFNEIRDICDEFKNKLKKSTAIGNVYLRDTNGKLTALAEHPNIKVDQRRPVSTDTLNKCIYITDGESMPILSHWKELISNPIILRMDEEDDDNFTDEDKKEYIEEIIEGLQKIFNSSSKKSKRKVSESSEQSKKKKKVSESSESEESSTYSESSDSIFNESLDDDDTSYSSLCSDHDSVYSDSETCQ
jgi:hypothetical protein